MKCFGCKLHHLLSCKKFFKHQFRWTHATSVWRWVLKGGMDIHSEHIIVQLLRWISLYDNKMYPFSEFLFFPFWNDTFLNSEWKISNILHDVCTISIHVIMLSLWTLAQYDLANYGYIAKKKIILLNSIRIRIAKRCYQWRTLEEGIQISDLRITPFD